MEAILRSSSENHSANNQIPPRLAFYHFFVIRQTGKLGEPIVGFPSSGARDTPISRSGLIAGTVGWNHDREVSFFIGPAIAEG